MNISAGELGGLDGICASLESTGSVFAALSGGGVLHIERLQPFLCVYRQPVNRHDEGTQELLSTQVSWLSLTENETRPTMLAPLLKTVLQYLSQRFGRALVIEIWSAGPGKQHEETAVLPTNIILHANDRDAPLETLEELDRALITAHWPAGSRPRIDICYKGMQLPPGVPALLTKKQCTELAVTSVGIEISPFYQSPENGQRLPQIHAELRANLGIAMKRAFYAFSTAHTIYRPAHYHELGPGQLEKIDIEVDAALSRIDKDVDLLLNVTPVNVSQTWQRFRRAKFQEPPEFHYRALRSDPVELKRRLFSIPIESVKDPALFHLFDDKRQELDRQISMLSDRGTRNFLLESQQVYGRPNAALLDTAKMILDRVPSHTHDDQVSDSVNAETFAQYAEREIAWYRERDISFGSRVEICSDIPGLLVSHGNFLVNNTVSMPKHRIEATLQHEIGTHALTHHNGGRQPLRLLQDGLAGYEALQEGLAVLSEFLVGGLSRPRFRQLAGRVTAIDQLVDGATFVDVYRSLHDHYGFSQLSAYTLIMRVFRGGGFTKDIVYLRGLLELLDHLETGSTMDELFIGKIALNHTEIVSELLWRKILQYPRLMPRYFEAEEPMARLNKIMHSSAKAIDIVMESLQ